jgi:glycosyltransferase involved in cell wall biosynthesis
MHDNLHADLVFVSMEPWDEIWRRNQFLCAGLLRRHAGMRILFVEPPRDVSNALRTRRWEVMQPAGADPAEFGGRLRRFRPLKLLPNGSAAGRGFNEWLSRRQIAAQMKKMRLEAPLLWINAHYAGHLAGRLEECAVIYDITDDWTELEQCAQGTALTRQQDAALCRAADAVIVCSERLVELKKTMCSELHLIPNGVDPEHYRCVLEGAGPLPAESAAWARPVFGYTGTVHPDRLDLDLVENVARSLPRGSIVLLGPNHLLPEQAARLQACGNVHLPGPVPYARIPEFMRAFDACIVPHRVTAFTESLNPIKLWEYLAAGKPIVSRDVAGFRDYAAVVSIARSSAEFVRAMQAALEEPAGAGIARRELVRGHSWETRLDQVEAVLAGCQADGALRTLPVH